jgi:hypothetical protein
MTNNRAAPFLNRAGTLTATRPASALHTQPSREAWSQAIDAILHEDGDVSEKGKAHVAALQSSPGGSSNGMRSTPRQLLDGCLARAAARTAAERKRATQPRRACFCLACCSAADKVRLPVLLKIASNPNHPLTGEALQYLQFLLEVDHGLDWDRWQEAIQRRNAESAVTE